MDPIKIPIHHILPVLRWYPGLPPPSISCFFFFFLQCCSISWLMRVCNWTHPSWLGQVRYLSLTHPLSFSLLLTATRLDWTLEEADVKLFASCLLACYISASFARPAAQKNEIAEPRARHRLSFHHLFNFALWGELVVYHAIRFCMLVGVMQQLIGPH